MAKMTIDIVIGPDGQVQADVVDGQGTKCITHLLAGLALYLGQPSDTQLKPEFEEDPEAQAIMRQIGVLS
jgi:hypothetical protein